MTFTAAQGGEYPTGLHWTAGETREMPAGAEPEAPDWLTPTPAPDAPAAPDSAPEAAPE